MYKIRTSTTALPEDVHRDFRRAAKLMQQSAQDAGFKAIEDYIAKVNALFAKLAEMSRNS